MTEVAGTAAAVTLMVTVSETAGLSTEVAVIVAVPAPTAVTTPAAVTVATASLEEDQVTPPVKEEGATAAVRVKVSPTTRFLVSSPSIVTVLTVRGVTLSNFVPWLKKAN